MNKLAKNYIYNVAYQVFVILVPLVTAPYLARVLHAENMGIYSYVTSWASTISTIGLLGLYNYGQRQVAYIREEQTKLNNTFCELLSIRSIMCILSSAFYLILACASEYREYFFLYYPWLLTGFLDISWLYAGIEDMGPMVLKNFFIKLINVIGIFVFVRDENDLSKYFFLVAIVSLAANMTMYWRIGEKITRWHFTLKNYRKHIKSAFLLFLPQLAAVFYLQVDKIMLQFITQDEKQLAFYDQAEKIVNIPFTLITALSVVMMPRIANQFQKGNLDSIKQYVVKTAHFAMLISIPMYAGINAIASGFVPWYLGNEYLPVVSVLSIVSTIILSNSLVNISGTQYFTAVDKTTILTLSNFSAAILNVVVNTLLIPNWGALGAAFATVLSSAFCVLIQFYFLNRSIPVKEILNGTWKYVIASAIMYIILNAIAVWMPQNPMATFAQILIGCMIYFGALIVLRETMFRELITCGKKYIAKLKGK